MIVLLQYFDTAGWVFWPVKTIARITYTVLVETLYHAQSINQPAEGYRKWEISATPWAHKAWEGL